MKRWFLGLISGTSADGVDAALACFDHAGKLAEPAIAQTVAYPPDLRAALLSSMRSDAAVSLQALGEMDQQVAQAFAEAALQVMDQANKSPSDIVAIGSHGQTLFHAPDGLYRHSLQIGDPNRIAAITGIDTIADFRRADMAAGGQGAPLAPALHAAQWRSDQDSRAVVNLGGIANITVLPADPNHPVVAFDSGPANCLMDGWHARHRSGPLDINGEWAAQGEVIKPLLSALCADPYFARRGPKSTGREYFDSQWLTRQLALHPDLRPVDVQATLLALSVHTIAAAITDSGATSVFLCGGGAHNQQLVTQLKQALPSIRIRNTDELGIPANDVEAVAFAWLAMRHTTGRPGNLPSVTGAAHSVILGGRYPAKTV